MFYIKNAPDNYQCDECDPEGVPTFLYGVKQTGGNKVEQIICLIHQAIALFCSSGIYVPAQTSINQLTNRLNADYNFCFGSISEIGV